MSQKKLWKKPDINESFLKVIFDNTVDVIEALDSDGIILYATPSVKLVYGYIPEELTETKFIGYVHPEDQDNLKKTLKKASKKPGILTEPVEMRINHKDGSWMDVECTITSPCEKQVISHVINFRNISEDKIIKKELFESEIKLKNITENINDLVVIMDARTMKCLYVSPTVKSILGFTQDEFIALGDTILTPESQQISANYYNRVFEDAAMGRPVRKLQFEIESKKKDGSTIWFETNYSFTYEPSGKLSTITGVNRDITERRKLEDALRKSEELYRMLAENIKDVIWLIDLSKGGLHDEPDFVTPSIMYITGYTPEEWINLPPGKKHLLGSEFPIREKLENIVNNAKHGKRDISERFESNDIRKDGSIANVEHLISGVYNAAGELVAIQGVSRDITGRRRLEEELRKSEEQYRMLAENMTDSVSIIDLNGETTYVSPSIQRHTGYTREEWINLPLEKSHSKETADAIKKTVSKIINSSRNGIKVNEERLEVSSKNKYGSIIYGEIIFSGMYNSMGEIIGIQSVARDITERKRLEEELRKSEELYRMLTEKSRDAIWTVIFNKNSDKEELPSGYLSPVIERITGYTPEEYIHMPYEKVHTNGTKSDLDKRFNELIDSVNKGILDKVVHYEETLRRKDSSIVWIEQVVSALFNDENKLIGLQGVYRDITERKKLEEELRKSEERYRMLTENSSDAIWFREYLDGKLMEGDWVGNYVSPSIKQIVGYNSEEFINLPLEKIYIPEDINVGENNINNILELGKQGIKEAIARFEQSLINKDGSIVHMEMIIKPMFNGRDELIGVQGMARDITERKKLEEALRERERYYRLLAENATDVIFTSDITSEHSDGKPDYVSPSIERILGYSPEEFLNMPMEAVHTPESVARITNLYKRMADKSNYGEHNEIETIEVTNIRKDGTYVQIEHTIRGFYDENNKLISVQGVSRDITERKKLEEALRRSEEQYRLLAENITDVITIFDLNGILIYQSPSMESQTGYTQEELSRFRQENIDILQPKESTDLVVKAVNKIINSAKSGIRGSKEYLYMPTKHKDGSIRQIELLLSDMYNDLGEFIGVQGVSRNITERKKLEDALRKSENYYRLLAENATDVIFISYISSEFCDGRPSYMSPSIERILGYTPEEFMNLPVEATHTPESAARVIDLYKRMSEKGWQEIQNAVERIEVTNIKKDGSFVQVEHTIRALYDENGVFVGVQGVSRDVTERKELEDALRKSEKLYRMLAENASDVIWTVELSDGTRKWKPVYISPSIQNLNGYTSDEWLKLPIEATHPPQSIEIVRNAYSRIEEYAKKGIKDRIERFEVLNIHKRDNVIYVEHIIQGMFNDEGKFIGIQGVSRDITERKWAEEELAKQAKDLARSNEDLEQFAYIASHDLQEPLRMVASFTELLSKRYKGRMDKDADEFINFAVSGANRMKQLINDLLDYSRVGTRAKPFMPTDCRMVLENAVNNLSITIKENNAVVNVDFLPSVMADEGQLTQLFQNLIANAIKFHGKNQPRIDISSEKKDGEWLFKVRDNGIGIASDYFDRIFNIFQRAHGKDYPGTGIGLAICKKIVERHGGHIWVESELDKGSTFYYTISVEGGKSK